MSWNQKLCQKSFSFKAGIRERIVLSDNNLLYKFVVEKRALSVDS